MILAFMKNEKTFIFNFYRIINTVRKNKYFEEDFHSSLEEAALQGKKNPDLCEDYVCSPPPTHANGTLIGY